MDDCKKCKTFHMGDCHPSDIIAVLQGKLDKVKEVFDTMSLTDVYQYGAALEEIKRIVKG